MKQFLSALNTSFCLHFAMNIRSVDQSL